MRNCKNCHGEMDDDTVFCTKCGSKMDEPEQNTRDGEEIQPKKSLKNIRRLPKKKIIVSAIVLASVLLLVYGGFFAKYKIDQKHLIEQLTTLLDGAESCERWTAGTEQRFGTYPMTADEKVRFAELLAAGEGLEEKDYKAQIAYITDTVTFEQGVTLRLDTEANKLLQELKGRDPGYASNDQKHTLSNYATQMQALIRDGNYTMIPAVSSEWAAFAEKAAQKKTGYQVRVMQYDFSRYPKVRAYLDIRNEADGQILKEFSPNMFYVSEKNAQTGKFSSCTITKAVQMNENERLNINLLADTSGSMSGDNMSSAKSIMKSFLSTVQFAAGDKVKMTPFNSTIEKFGVFSNDLNGLCAEIDNYYATGQTKLYDSIIYGVQDVLGQEGARCVLAFTDGMDVGSYSSAQDVIDTVSQHNVPVFIVRIGDSSTSAEDSMLMQIADASGGGFKNLSQFSSDMTSFYNQIYRQLKQYYVVEYDALGTSNLTDTACYSMYVQKDEMGGETELTANPGNEMFDTLLGLYLRSYICDMNSHSYNQIAKYIDAATDANDKLSIQWQMKQQVSGGFGDIEEETIMNYSVTGITLQDENTVLLSANEDYNVVYYEEIGELRKRNSSAAKQALEFISDNYGYDSIPETEVIRVWAKVNQSPQYILKKDANGEWKFSKFHGSIKHGPIEVFDVELE